MKFDIILFVLTSLLVTIYMSDEVIAEKRLRFTIKNVTTWSDNNFLNLSYTIDEKIPTADVLFKILNPIPSVDFQIEGKAVIKNNKKYYGALNTSYNLCQLLSMKNMSPITVLLFAHLKNYGHLPESCPIKKDTFTLNKVWPSDHLAQLKLPEIEFEVKLKAYAIENNDTPILIMDAHLVAEAIYMEVSGEMKRTGLLSIWNNGR